MADDQGCCDRNLYNIIVLGFAFMLIFTAFQTGSMAEKSVLDSAQHDSNGTFKGDGYISLSIIYIVFSVSNFGAPSCVALIGPKFSMLVGSVMYFLFILSFLKPMTWALYLASVLVGLGAAILWTGQGNFLTINSSTETLTRNSGIFWAMLQCSLLFGNMYSYFVLKGTTDITSDDRTKLYAGLSGAALLGVLSLLFLRPQRPVDSVNLNSSGSQQVDTPLTALKRSFYLLKTREMLMLSVAIAYTGLELTFFSGVYGTCLSNTKQFGSDAKGLIGISGMFIGVGEILGGAVFGLFGKRTNKYGRDPIVVFGYLVHMIAFFLIFINLPEESPINSTGSDTYMTSSTYVAILCSFLLGLGDSSFNTQLYSLVGFMYPEDSPAAFALFKFAQSISAAVAFYYSTYLLLKWQLLILVVLGSLGTLCFSSIEWSSTKASREGFKSI
ncbi:hypothetical protein ACJMK2_033837 [Sinanodonta woodiana]|uniref:UNC93-like protein MFSD11 n=1 Tax=Sinanodonta woodiana TaxID=1069815 RepID=A0ABD3WT53_SINWO